VRKIILTDIFFGMYPFRILLRTVSVIFSGNRVLKRLRLPRRRGTRGYAECRLSALRYAEKAPARLWFSGGVPPDDMVPASKPDEYYEILFKR
jgi:hypothetical protein